LFLNAEDAQRDHADTWLAEADFMQRFPRIAPRHGPYIFGALVIPEVQFLAVEAVAIGTNCLEELRPALRIAQILVGTLIGAMGRTC